MTHCSVGLLGGFSLRHRGVAISVPASAQRVIALLALKPRTLQRVYVASLLWGHASDGRAIACLRTALWRLRQVDAGLVEATSTHVALARPVEVDVHAIAASARRILEGSWEDSLPAGGVLLPDWYDEWLTVERERFDQLRLHALESLCARLLENGQYARVVDLGLGAIALDPLRESAYRLVIRAYIAEGNTAAAVRVLDGFKRLLRSRVGIGPSPQMQTLEAALRS
jgi:DNA-binding SARP family transcriptional activator